MGFSSGFYSIIIIFPKPFLVVLCLFDRMRFALSTATFYLCGGFSTYSSEGQLSSFYIFVPPSSIKKRLPVIEFRSYSKCSMDGEENALCPVCLEVLEANHEIRELSNCCHAFHKHCIDEWIDIGQLTCPLCRAQLLPDGIEEALLTS